MCALIPARPLRDPQAPTRLVAIVRQTQIASLGLVELLELVSLAAELLSPSLMGAPVMMTQNALLASAPPQILATTLAL